MEISIMVYGPDSGALLKDNGNLEPLPENLVSQCGSQKYESAAQG